VRDFSLLTVDDRYSTPTLRFLTVASVPRAREHAERILGESPHHLSMEVWEGEVLLFRLQRHDVLEPQRETVPRNAGAQGRVGRRPSVGA
jgi:hypothetical protein